jgi:hypothetical protein
LCLRLDRTTPHGTFLTKAKSSAYIPMPEGRGFTPTSVITRPEPSPRTEHRRTMVFQLTSQGYALVQFWPTGFDRAEGGTNSCVERRVGP